MQNVSYSCIGYCKRSTFGVYFMQILSGIWTAICREMIAEIPPTIVYAAYIMRLLLSTALDDYER